MAHIPLLAPLANKITLCGGCHTHLIFLDVYVTRVLRCVTSRFPIQKTHKILGHFAVLCVTLSLVYKGGDAGTNICI